jgi:VWFA-related protein
VAQCGKQRGINQPGTPCCDKRLFCTDWLALNIQLAQQLRGRTTAEEGLLPSTALSLVGSNVVLFTTNIEHHSLLFLLVESENLKSRWVAAVCVLLSSAILSTLRAQANPSRGGPVPVAAGQINLSAAGYHGLSRMARLTDEAELSLNFVDRDHVLITFNPKKLFTRLSDCPPGHADRLVHAAVLELPTGKIVKETDWYLHDHRRYLWPLGSGKFLLRKLNSLYVFDSGLHEQLLISSPKDLLWVTVTPDERQIIVGTRESENLPIDTHPGAEETERKGRQKFQLEFVDVDTLAIQRTIALQGIVDLDGTSAGYTDFIQKNDLYLIRFGPTPEQRRNIARVRSRCVPEVFYPSAHSLLIGRCPVTDKGEDSAYAVSAFTVTGRRLWRQQWSQRRYFATIARSEDNSRFAISTLERKDSPVAAANADSENSDTEADINGGLEQSVQVFDTASGNPIQSVAVSPVVKSGQNFSLSPDGRRLVVLNDSGLEFYDLSPASEEERAKFTALKADMPGLYVVSSKSGADVQMEAEPGAGSNDQETPAGAADALSKSSPVESDASAATGDAAQHAALPLPVVSARPTTAEDPGGPITTIKASTQAVVVDVVVTDSQGHPIKGLQKKDFQVSEDGKTQDVRYFRNMNSAPAPGVAAPAPAMATPQPPANVFSNSAHATDPGPVTLILLDMVNTPSEDQQHARDQLINFLKTKPKNAQFALCSLSSNRALHLRLIQGFTPDENTLLAAVNSKNSSPQSARWQEAAAGTEKSVDTVRDAAQEGPTGGWAGLLSGLQAMQAEQQVTDTDARVGITVDALMQLARYLAGIPGRKNLIWLSGSFPLQISGTDFDNPNADNRNYSSKLKEAASLLGDGQVAVYPVDVRVRVGRDVVSASSKGVGSRGTATAVAPGQPASDESPLSPNQALQQGTMQALALQSAERDTLNQIASDTGGKAFFNSNAIDEAISMATEQGSNYYTLSYDPTNRKYDGRFRKIKVTVAEKGYRLHHRPGYFADDPSAPGKHEDLYRNIGAAMQHGSPQSRQILFSVRVVPTGEKRKVEGLKAGENLIASTATPGLPAKVEVQRFGIDYAADSSDLHFIPKEGGIQHCALNFVIAAYDEAGRQLSGVSHGWTSDLKPEDYQDVITGGVRVHQEVDVPLKAVSLRLGIIDALSHRLGTIEIPLPVPAPSDQPRIVRHSLPEIEPD